MFVQSNQPHTFVVVTLDPPIRKGQTLYPHIVMQVLLAYYDANHFGFLVIFMRPCTDCLLHLLQFETDYVVQSELSLSEELLNTKYKDKLEPSYKVMKRMMFQLFKPIFIQFCCFLGLNLHYI